MDFPGSIEKNILSSRRMQEHQKAKAFFDSGNYELAITLLEQALIKYGPHVGLLSDLTAAYQLANNPLGANESLTRLDEEFCKAAPLLSDASKVKTAVILSRFYDEKAKINEALEALDLVVECQTKKLRPDAQIAYDCQRLLLMAEFRLKRAECFLLKNRLASCQSIPSKPLHSTIQFTLLATEAHLTGAIWAWPQLEALLRENTFTGQLDKDFYISELLFAFLTQKVKLPEDFFDVCIEAGFSGSYEFLLFAVLSFEPKYWLSRFLRANLFLGLKLRLALAAYSHFDDSEVRKELQKFVVNSMLNLSSESQKIWHSRFHFSSNRENCVRISLEEAKARFNDQTVDLKRKKNSLILLTQLSNKSPMPLEDFCRNVWGVELDESFFNRVRIQVLRTNAFFKQRIGLDELVSLKDNALILSPQVKIVNSGWS